MSKKYIFNLSTLFKPDSDQLFSIGDDSRLVAIDKRQFQRVRFFTINNIFISN